jgi:hypothetical protein
MTDNVVPPTAANEPPTATHRGAPGNAAARPAPPEGAATEGAATEHATADDAVELRIDRDEAQALLLAVDALTPLLDRIRQEVAPEPEPEPQSEAPAAVATPDYDDALHRATRLARESLREARMAIGRGRPSAEQRRAWQEAARRYVAERASRRTGTGSSRR